MEFIRSNITLLSAAALPDVPIVVTAQNISELCWVLYKSVREDPYVREFAM